METESVAEFVRLFSQSQYRVLRFIRTLVPNLAEAEDILQETSTILWKKWPEFDPERDFTKWACGIARLEVFRALRQRNQNRLYLSDVVLNQIADFALAASKEQDAWESSQDALKMCLRELPVLEQQLIHLRYHFDKTVQQIADEHHRPKSTIHDQLVKVRSRLLHCVKRRLSM
jgi:RNA polymerase sigma-70 factor, ECF subfamily